MSIIEGKFGNSDNVVGLIDSRYPTRWLDAHGDVHKFIFDQTYLAAEWTVTATGTSPIAPSLVADAVALITTGGSDFDGDNMQHVGTRFKLESGKPLYFGAKLTINEATQSDLLVGLAGIDTTLTAATSTHALAVSAGFVGFTKIDNVTAGYFKNFNTATESSSIAAFTCDVSAHIYEIIWDGTLAYGYYDGVLIGSLTPTTEVVTPSINFRTGSAAAKTCTIHWLRCIQARS
jgi:hypothetical protein